MKESNRTDKTGKKITSKQAAAILGIVLLVLMYIAALIAAVADKSASGSLFRICLYATVTIPILIWIYTWMYGKLTRKHTFADFEPDGKNGQADNQAGSSETDTEQD